MSFFYEKSGEFDVFEPNLAFGSTPADQFFRDLSAPNFVTSAFDELCDQGERSKYLSLCHFGRFIAAVTWLNCISSQGREEL